MALSRSLELTVSPRFTKRLCLKEKNGKMTEEDSEKENSGLHTPPTPYLLSLVVSQGDALG